MVGNTRHAGLLGVEQQHGIHLVPFFVPYWHREEIANNGGFGSAYSQEGEPWFFGPGGRRPCSLRSCRGIVQAVLASLGAIIMLIYLCSWAQRRRKQPTSPLHRRLSEDEGTKPEGLLQCARTDDEADVGEPTGDSGTLSVSGAETETAEPVGGRTTHDTCEEAGPSVKRPRLGSEPSTSVEASGGTRELPSLCTQEEWLGYFQRGPFQEQPLDLSLHPAIKPGPSDFGLHLPPQEDPLDLSVQAADRGGLPDIAPQPSPVAEPLGLSLHLSGQAEPLVTVSQLTPQAEPLDFPPHAPGAAEPLDLSLQRPHTTGPEELSMLSAQLAETTGPGEGSPVDTAAPVADGPAEAEASSLKQPSLAVVISGPSSEPPVKQEPSRLTCRGEQNTSVTTLPDRHDTAALLHETRTPMPEPALSEQAEEVLSDSGEGPSGAFPAPFVTDPEQHGYYRLARLGPGVTARPFSPGRASSYQWAAPSANVPLRQLEALLSKKTIDGKDAMRLVEILERVMAHCFHYQSRDPSLLVPHLAAGTLGLRFILMDAIVSAFNVLEKTPPGIFWEKFTRAMPHKFTLPEGTRLSRRTRHLLELTSRLTSAMEILKTGQRPPAKEVVQIKEMLFCSSDAPSRFRRAGFDAWRRHCPDTSGGGP